MKKYFSCLPLACFFLSTGLLAQSTGESAFFLRTQLGLYSTQTNIEGDAEITGSNVVGGTVSAGIDNDLKGDEFFISFNAGAFFSAKVAVFGGLELSQGRDLSVYVGEESTGTDDLQTTNLQFGIAYFFTPAFSVAPVLRILIDRKDSEDLLDNSEGNEVTSYNKESSGSGYGLILVYDFHKRDKGHFGIGVSWMQDNSEGSLGSQTQDANGTSVAGTYTQTITRFGLSFVFSYF